MSPVRVRIFDDRFKFFKVFFSTIYYYTVHDVGQMGRKKGFDRGLDDVTDMAVTEVTGVTFRWELWL